MWDAWHHRGLQDPTTHGFLDVFRSKRMFVLLLLGFSGGIPLYLTSQVLQAWVTAVGVELDRIADLSLVGLAYTLKFAWGPLLDRYRLPFLGRRRGWCLALQLSLMVAIAWMGTIDPLTEPLWLAGFAIAVAFLSASQDVIIDAYKTDILAPHERAAGNAAYLLGYRTAMLLTGTVALGFADYVSWTLIYGAAATLLVVGIIGTLLADEPAVVATPPRTLGAAVVRPFFEFFERLGWRGAMLVLVFAAVYRFGDFFAQSLIIPFLKRGSGFDFLDIALVYKLLGFAGTAVGVLFAGSLITRFGLRRTLVTFGLLAALTNVIYVWLAIAGKSFPIFCAAVFIDNASNMLATTAFLAVLTGVCSPAVSATQFALLTSLSSVGQRVFGPLANDVVDRVGWDGFFAVTSALALPGLVMAWWVAKRVPTDK